MRTIGFFWRLLIPVRWNERARSLTIGEREGACPEMVAKRTFRIILARSGHGAGGEITSKPDKEIVYDARRSGQPFASQCVLNPAALLDVRFKLDI